VKVQILNNVCNGGHLFEFDGEVTAQELVGCIVGYGKVVAIVGNPPSINEDCDCDDCQNPEDGQEEMRNLLDSIVATGNEGMLVKWKRPRCIYSQETKQLETELVDVVTTLYAKRVGAWSETGTLYFIKTQPIE
jgi:hypothetical protein